MNGRDSERSNNGDAGSDADSDVSGKNSPRGEATNQSGRVTFPNSVRSAASSANSQISAGHIPSENPFTMPPDNDIFLVRDKERQKKKNERMRQRNLKVHEKTTTTSKIGFRQAAMIKGPDIDALKSESEEGSMAVKEDPQFTIAVTRDRQVEKETLSEYIAKKREMFLLQYSLGVKRDEMRKLEDIAVAEEKKLELAEQYLEEDAAMFDEFLKENDKNSVEAIRIAEEEAKAKLNKVAEIKRLNTNMMQIKSEINKYEEQLKEYKMYKRFLDRLIPEDVKKEREEARKKRHEEKRKIKEELDIERERSEASSKQSKKGPRRSSRGRGGDKSRERPPSEDPASKLEDKLDEYSSDEEDLELYFKDPQQLLDIFTELEESNLNLIQNCQETEESLEEMRQAAQLTKEKKERETAILAEQIDKMNKAIVKEEEKARELELKSKMFSFGEFQAEDQKKMLQELNGKVEDVYGTCIGDNEANISTLQMLTNIENRIEELFQMIEMMPQDKVEAAQKAKEKERRLKMREEKKEQQRLHQEERVRKALERAKAAPKKQTGRRLMTRSNPPMVKKKDDGLSDQRSREEEELAYFFT